MMVEVGCAQGGSRGFELSVDLFKGGLIMVVLVSV